MAIRLVIRPEHSPATRPATAWNAVSSMPFPACTDRSAIHFPRVQAVPPADRTREFLPAFSIVITVDTGVDAAGKHGKAKERKEGSAAELSEKMQGDPVCLCVKKIPTITEAVQEMTRPSSRYPRAVISPCDVPAFCRRHRRQIWKWMSGWRRQSGRNTLQKRVQSADRFRALLHQLSVPGISYRRSR